jgi:hypothetical protein
VIFCSIWQGLLNLASELGDFQEQPLPTLRMLPLSHYHNPSD